MVPFLHEQCGALVCVCCITKRTNIGERQLQEVIQAWVTVMLEGQVVFDHFIIL